MQSPTESILRAVNSTKSCYNVLTAPTHEAYETSLVKTKHEFYAYRQPGRLKEWNTKYRPIPPNYNLLDGTKDQFKPDMIFDIILSQNKFDQFGIFKPLSDGLNIPLISLEHTLPVPQWGKSRRSALKAMRGDLNVFISEFSVKEWGFELDDPTVRIIYHGIDTNLFCPSTTNCGHDDGKLLSVVNSWVERDWCCGWSIYRNISKDLPINPIGDTPGFSKPAQSTEELVKNYQNAAVFVNTSIISPIPTSILEAAACECPIVSTYNCQIPYIFKDGYDGFFSNDEKYLRDRLEWCLKNPTEAKELGKNARKTILEKHSLEQFVTGWNNVFKEAYGLAHNV